jgi:aminoglycoside 6-adenylyltransferase
MLIEWDHHARYGPDYDVRFLGSRMRQWMDSDIQEDLKRCWGHFDARDSADALRCSISLFAKVAVRIAETLHFKPFRHDRLRQEVETILGGDSEAA